MNVRLISGKYGGRIIQGSATSRTHPMGERIRGALFNMLGNMNGGELENATVLDVFAGSGSLGLEALSRGALAATFVEKDRTAQKVITDNIALLGVEGQSKLIKAPAASWLETTEERFDIIFADPPYHDLQLATVFKLKKLLKPNGLMVLSYQGSGEVPTELGVVVVDNRSFGNAALAFYRKKSA